MRISDDREWEIRVDLNYYCYQKSFNDNYIKYRLSEEYIDYDVNELLSYLGYDNNKTILEQHDVVWKDYIKRENITLKL